ncbi:hypothetical protein ACP70R_034866 [Stipagrostis hirtigluma subsp. patula]
MKGGKLQLELAQVKGEQMDLLEGQNSSEPLGVLFLALWLLKLKPKPDVTASAATEQSQELKKKATPTKTYDDIINETAQKLKKHMEVVEEGGPGAEQAPLIRLHEAQYAHILWEVFPTMTSKPQDQDTKQQATKTTSNATALSEEQIKEMIHK